MYFLVYIRMICAWNMLFCSHIDEEERVGRFALFVFLVSRDCCVALPQDAMGLFAACLLWLWYFLIILTYYFGTAIFPSEVLSYCLRESVCSLSFQLATL